MHFVVRDREDQKIYTTRGRPLDWSRRVEIIDMFDNYEEAFELRMKLTKEAGKSEEIDETTSSEGIIEGLRVFPNNFSWAYTAVDGWRCLDNDGNILARWGTDAIQGDIHRDICHIDSV